MLKYKAIVKLFTKPQLCQKLNDGSCSSLSAASKRQKVYFCLFFPLIYVMDLKKLLEVYYFKSETSYCFIGGTVVLSFFAEGEIVSSVII